MSFILKHRLFARMSSTLAKYPTVRRDEKTFYDFFNGKHRMLDPYRWLEDPDSAETKEFVQAQNAVTHEHLNKWPQKEQFRSKLTALYDYERFSCPFRPSATDGYFFFFYNSGLQAQSSLYRQKSYNLSIDSAELFFDPNTLREDGTASLTTYSFSESGAYFAYGVSYNGSDWVTINVKNTKTLKDSATDVLEWAKFTGIAWTHDGDGFFYQRFEKPPTDDAGTETGANVCGMLCYHKIGTEQSKDVLWFQDKANPENMSGAEVTDDGRYLVMTITSGCDPVNKLYLVDLKSHMFHGESGGPKFVKVSDNFEAEYSYITNEDSKFFFKTNLKAPRYKVVTYDLENTSAGFVDVIAQSTDVLQFAVVFNENKLAVSSLKDVKSTLAIYSLNGKKIHDVALPIGSVDSITGKKSLSDIFFKFSSFTNPGIIYRYDGKDSSMDTIKETKLSVASTDNFSVEQVFYPSLDGTKIPMFIISKKDMVKNGSNPTLLYGYGGFNISLTPMFSPTWMCFVAHLNGIVAVPNIRGGGEYGEDWHKAGSLAKKQNCFDDFQCAAKWLVANKYSSHSKIGINGGSNGGLLVGACVNQAPELFGCAMADVGVMDMLRFHKFTIGHAWKSDYGDPDVEKDFEVMLKYSPVHTVNKTAAYPPTLILTSDHDDRVVPLHSYKYIAELQHHRSENAHPLVIRVETKAGHGAGKPTKKRIDEATDRVAFFAQAVSHEWSE